MNTKQEIHYDTYEDDWVPQDYLKYYYSTVNADEEHTVRFFADGLKEIKDAGDILYFGCGPTLHHVFLAAPKARTIHLADYLKNNMDEVQRWLAGEIGAHDWRPFVHYTLTCEGNAQPSDEDVSEREQVTKSKITRLLSETDVNDADPLGEEGAARYDTVISAYCADAVTTDKEIWRQYMRNIASMVAPGGHFLVSALGNTKEYHVNGKVFPCVNLSKEDMIDALKLDFVHDSIKVIEVTSLGEQEALGYTGIILARAQKAI